MRGGRRAQPGPSNYFVWTSQDLRGRSLTSLGLEVPAIVDQLAGDSFHTDLSTERLGLLDEGDSVTRLTNPGTANSRSSSTPGARHCVSGRRGRSSVIGERGVALSIGSVPSLPGPLETLPQEFAARLGP
jgi:iron complex transport system substrate-binding protein